MCRKGATEESLSHLWQSFPLQAFGLGRSCLVTAGFRRRPMVVKPTLTFRSGEKIVYGSRQPLNLPLVQRNKGGEVCQQHFSLNMDQFVRSCEGRQIQNKHRPWCAKFNKDSSRSSYHAKSAAILNVCSKFSDALPPYFAAGKPSESSKEKFAPKKSPLTLQCKARQKWANNRQSSNIFPTKPPFGKRFPKQFLMRPHLKHYPEYWLDIKRA